MNGEVSYSNSSLLPGTVAEYSCNMGYILIGDGSRTCTHVSDTVRVWDPSTSPSCNSKLIMLFQCDMFSACRAIACLPTRMFRV